MAQLRLVMRTARGRSTVLSPLLGFIVLAVVSSRGGVGVFSLLPRNGVGLAAVGAFFGVTATLPLAMNQFAIDGAGLTLQLLSPLSDDDLLNGKAVANGVLAGALTLLCMLVALVVYPGGSVGLWISVPLATAAMVVLLAPVAAALSAIFPRAVDLNSAGRGSNAHGVAGLVGLAAIALSGVPPAALAVFAIRGLQRPELTAAADAGVVRGRVGHQPAARPPGAGVTGAAAGKPQHRRRLRRGQGRDRKPWRPVPARSAVYTRGVGAAGISSGRWRRRRA